jgi:hypothetical protein
MSDDELMRAWLARPLFDEVPEGVPPLEPEDDDEGGPVMDDGDFAADLSRWLTAPAAAFAAGGQHWKDELRIPKGNGDASGQWTFTPWKHLGLVLAEMGEVGKGLGYDDVPEYNERVRAKIEVAKTLLSALDKDEASTMPGDPIVKTSSEVAGQLFLDAAMASKEMGVPHEALEAAAKGSLAFAKYDWSLFDESTDIGTNDPDDDFGELLTDEETDIGAGEASEAGGPLADWEKELLDIAAKAMPENTKSAKDLKAGDAVVTYDEEGNATAVLLEEVIVEKDGVSVMDQDGASWVYGLDDPVEVEPDEDDAPQPEGSKKAGDLKPGDTIVVSGPDGPLAVEIDYINEDMDGNIEVVDAEGVSGVFGPNDDVEVMLGDDEAGTPQSGTMTKAKDLKPGDTVIVADSQIGPHPVQIDYINSNGVDDLYQIVGTDGSGTMYDGDEYVEVLSQADAPPPGFKKAADLKTGDVVVESGDEFLPLKDVQVGGGKVTVTDEMGNKWQYDVGDDIEVKAPEPGPLDVGDTVYVDGEGAVVVENTPSGPKVKYDDGTVSDPLSPSEYTTGEAAAPAPAAPPTKKAEDLKPGDTFEMFGTPLEVASVEAVEDTIGGGPPYVSVTTTGGGTFAFAHGDDVPILGEAAANVPEATRADFLGLSPLTPNEKAAIKTYGNPIGYKTVNPYLNNDGQVFDSGIMKLRPATASEKEFAEKTIAALDSAFEKAAPLAHDVSVLRRTDDYFGGGPMAPGAKFKNLAYVSTALPGGKKNGYGYENKKVHWDITLPKGLKALQGNAHENEILLPRGLEFEVESDTTDADGVRHLKVRAMRPEGSDAAEGHESPAAVPVGGKVQLLPVSSGGTPVEYTKTADDTWTSVDPVSGGTVISTDADLEEAWDTLFVQEEADAPDEVPADTVEVHVPVKGSEILPGDKLVLDGAVLKKSGGKLVPSTGATPTVAEVKHGPKWANVVTTSGQKLWVPTGADLTVKREVEQEVKTLPTTMLLPGDVLSLEGGVLKKSAGKLIPAEPGSQGKHDEKPTIATVKHGPKWTEITATSGQKLWILSGTEVPAERTPGLATPGASAPSVPGSASWKGKPAPVAPPEPVEPKPGVPKPGSFDEWLLKVKARYDANPNKAKGSLEDSYSWGKVQSVMGSDPALAKTGMESLHQGQYLDDALFEEAKQIWADSAVLKPGEAIKYANEHVAWKKQMATYEQMLADWQKANPTSLKGMDGGKVFGSNSAGVAWANKTLPKPPLHTHAQIKSMKGSSGYVNGQLWNNGGKVPDSVKTEVASLDAAMAPLPEDIYLFRGTNLNEFKGVGSVEDLKKAVGTTFVQHAFQPTGLGVDTHFSSSAIQIVYRAPKGTKGVWARPIKPPPFEAEREFMLARNTKYFIHKVTQKNGQTFVEAEIIPEGHPDPTGQPAQGLTGKVGTYFARLRRPA